MNYRNNLFSKYLILLLIMVGVILYISSYNSEDYQRGLNFVGFFLTFIGTIIATYQLNKEKKVILFFKDTINDYIEDLYISINQVRYLQGIILENNKDFKNFKNDLGKKHQWNFSILKNTENTIIDLTDEYSIYLIDKFLSNIDNFSLSRNALKNFVAFTILTQSKFSHLSERIKNRGENDVDFNKLLSAYYKHEIKDDMGKISRFASSIETEKLKGDVFNYSEDLIKKTSEHEREKLFSYVSSMIKKEVGITTLHNITKSSKISNRYIIYLSRDRICKVNEIKNYLENKGAINILASTYGDVLLFTSEISHESIENFVDNELLNQLTQDCPYLIFVIELTPMSYYKKNYRGVELDSIYVTKSNQIDEIYYNKMLDELLMVSGKPVYDIIENATIDFFTDELSTDDLKKLRYNNESIINSCIDSSKSSWSKTKSLVDVSQNKLTNVLIETCDFDFDKATSISGSILKNVFLWRKLLYGETL